MSPIEKEAYNQTADTFNAVLKEHGVTILPPEPMVTLNHSQLETSTLPSNEVSVRNITQSSLLRNHPVARVANNIARWGAIVGAVAITGAWYEASRVGFLAAMGGTVLMLGVDMLGYHLGRREIASNVLPS